MKKQNTYSLAEFAELVGVNRTTVWRHATDGTLPTVGGRVAKSVLASVLRAPSYAVWKKLRTKGVAG